MSLDFTQTQRVIYVCLFIGYANYAYNRKAVSLAMPTMMDHDLSKSDAGLIASSQNLAFALSKFMAGILSDQMSARLLFFSGLFLSGIVTVIFPIYDSVLLYTILWFINGLGQGAGWPACAKIIKHWSPPNEFGTWWSVLSASTNVSGMLTPFFATFLIYHFDWKVSLFVSGIMSVLVAGVCLLYVRNSPEDLGWKSYSPQQKIKKKTNTKEGMSSILQSQFLWLLCLGYGVVFCAKTSAVDWGQMFLMEEKHHSQFTGSSFVSSLELGGFVGGVASGYLTDWLLTKPQYNIVKSNPRMPVAFVFTVGVATGLHWFAFYINEDTSNFIISLVGFYLGTCLYGSISIFGVVASENAPPHLSGTAHAIVSLAANIGAVLSGLPFSYLAKLVNWSGGFILLEFVTWITVIILWQYRNMKSKIGHFKDT